MPTSTYSWILCIQTGAVLQSTDMRYFTCGFLPAKQVGFPKSILEDSWRIMINDEIMWNFVVNENDYDIFPLASIFDPPNKISHWTEIFPQILKIVGEFSIFSTNYTKPSEKGQQFFGPKLLFVHQHSSQTGRTAGIGVVLACLLWSEKPLSLLKRESLYVTIFIVENAHLYDSNWSHSDLWRNNI